MVSASNKDLRSQFDQSHHDAVVKPKDFNMYQSFDQMKQNQLFLIKQNTISNQLDGSFAKNLDNSLSSIDNFECSNRKNNTLKNIIIDQNYNMGEELFDQIES